MNSDGIKLLYKYNYWANQRILVACEKIAPEQFAAKASFGSIRAALVHILESEWGWRERLQGHPEVDDLTETDVPTPSDLRTRWQTDEQAMWTYLDKLTDADLSGTIRYPIPNNIIRERVLWHCLLHVVNHGTQHRSEAAALLTSYGQSPGELDFTGFLNEYFHLPS